MIEGKEQEGEEGKKRAVREERGESVRSKGRVSNDRRAEVRSFSLGHFVNESN